MNTTTHRRHGRGGSHVSRRRSGNNTSRRSGFSSSRESSHTHRRAPQGRGRKIPTFDPSQFINTNPVDAVPEAYTPKHTFSTFGLDNRIVRNTTARKLSVPTPIQDQVIPLILEGHDVIGLAETGTGKTAAFLLPLIHKTLSQYKRQTLVLAPTRELALQIEGELIKLAEGMRLYSTVCVGGTAIGPQIKGLRRTNHFVIGTPGRVLDLIDRGYFDPSRVTTVVLDEADRMLDMGFIHDMRKILKETPKERETLFFSATMSKDTEALVHDFLRNPKTVSVKKKDVTNSIEQNVVPYTHDAKFDTLVSLLKDPECARVIIFGAMKHSVEKLAKQLSAHGLSAESIHGNKSHGQRQRALARFKSGNARILVATDVAARGIHVDNVSHVINYDLPNTFEDYVHRIGRTGRAHSRGKALTFIPA